jgi:TolA-binding protein
VHLATPCFRPGRAARRWASGFLILTAAVPAWGQDRAKDAPADGPAATSARQTPEALLLANTFLRDRRYDLAAEQYEKFLETAAPGPDAAEARFGLANARLFLGEYKEARRQFEAFLEAAPEHANAPTAWFRVGETAYMLGDLRAARVALEKYTAANPGHRFLDMAWPYLGDVCFALKDLPKAREAYEKALAGFPEGRLVERAKYGLGRTLAAQGEFDGALTLFAELAKQGHREWADKARYQVAEVHTTAGRADEQRGQADAASRHFAASVSAYEAWEKAVPRAASLPEARLHKAEVLLKLGRRDEAEALLRPLAAEGPQTLAVQAAYALGNSRLERGKAAEALEVWADALKRFPDTPIAPMVLYRSAEALLKLGQGDAARTRLRKLADDYPKDPWADDALLRAATLALEASDPAGARALAASLRTRFPDSPLRADARLVEARAALVERKPKEAIELLDALLAEDRPGPQAAQAARYYLGLAYKADGQSDKSERVLDDLAQTPSAPFATDAQFLVGQGHFQARRYAGAIAPLEKYLAGKPKGDVAAHARAYLAVARARLGQAEPARAALDQLAGQFPDSEPLAWARLALGSAALNEKQYGRAAELLAPVVEGKHAKYRTSARADLGWALLGLGKPAEAAAQFAALLDSAPDHPLAPEAALARGQALEAARSADEALAAYALVVEKYPKSDQSGPAALARARLLARLKRPGEAASAFEHYLDAHPRAGEGADAPDAILAEWGAALLDANKPAEADRVFARLLKERPDSPRAAEARVNLADSAYQARDYAEVARLLEPVVADGATVDATWRQCALYRLGRARLDQGDWATSAQLFGRLVAEYPDGQFRAKGRFWKAEAAFQGGDAKAAEAEFAALLAAPPSDADTRDWVLTARLRRIQALVQLERWKDALAQADALKAEVPNYAQMAEVDYARARALQGTAHLDEALAAYQAVIDAPRKASDLAARAQWMRGEVFMHKRSYRDALREFLLVDYRHKAPKWQAAALLEAGKACEQLDRWTEAVELYTKLRTRFPDDPTAAEALKRLAVAKQRAPAPARDDTDSAP